MLNINIYDYFDRWMANYIVYHTGHLEKYGDVERAYTHFNLKFENAMANLKETNEAGQIASIQANMRSKAYHAARGLQVLNNMEQGVLLDQTLEAIAEGLNQAIGEANQQVNFDNYQDILRESTKFNGLFAHGDASVKDIDEFFSLILKALQQAKMIDLAVLDALSGISVHLGGTNFALDSKLRGQVKTMSNQDAKGAQKVIEYLDNAANKLDKQGALSSRSFATTINFIFQRVIGNQLQRILVAEGLQYLEESADNIVDREMKKSLGKDVKFEWVNKPQHTKTSSNFNGSVIDNDMFHVRVRKDKLLYDIEIGSSVEAKWYKGGVNESMAPKVIGRGSVRDFFGDDMQEKYLAYNVIAHANGFKVGKKGRGFSTKGYEREIGYDRRALVNTYSKLRASIAASYFNDWLKSGAFRSPTGGRAQFLIINGKVYSVTKIINNICNDIAKRVGFSKTGAFDMNIPSVRNEWQTDGDDDRPNKQLALKRSQIVNGLIDTITISMTLNPNILLKYV